MSKYCGCSFSGILNAWALKANVAVIPATALSCLESWIDYLPSWVLLGWEDNYAQFMLGMGMWMEDQVAAKGNKLTALISILD